MESVIIGEKKTFFWRGEKFVFERVGRGEWKLLSGQDRVPPAIKDDLGE